MLSVCTPDERCLEGKRRELYKIGQNNQNRGSSQWDLCL